MEVLSFPEHATPPHWRRQVLALQRAAWPPDPALPLASLSHDPALTPRTLLLVVANEVLSALDLLSIELTHAGRRWRVGGLSTVVTRPDVRGEGHGRTLVSVARRVMAASDRELGLFTCDRSLANFYGSTGWLPVPGAVLVGGSAEAPFPSDQPGFDKVTVGAFFTRRARRHLRDFANARIELYSGDIDKLW